LGFYVQVGPSGALLLRGELDIATIQDLQDKIDEVLVRGQPVVLDLAQLTFLDSSAIHCFLRACEASGHPVGAAEHDLHRSPHLGLRDAGVRSMDV